MNFDNIIIYHDPCNDGHGAALAAWIHFKGNAYFLPWNYGKDALFEKEHLPFMEGKNVYILDFSFNPDLTRRIIAVAKTFVWLDHHKTSFDKWAPEYAESGLYEEGSLDGEEKQYYICLDNNRSGARLAWEYFAPNVPLPRLFRHLDDYDRWVFDIPGTKSVNQYLRSQPMSFSGWYDIMREMEGQASYTTILTIGDALMQAFEEQVRQADSSAARPFLVLKVTGESIAGWGANASKHFSSELGHLLATRSGTYGLTWYQADDGKIRVSLRSNGDFDVSEIAKKLGGGGHKNAAGFEIEPHSTQAEDLIRHNIIRLY